MRPIENGQAAGSDLEESLGAASSFRCRLAQMRLDVPLRFQPVERCIDCSNRNFAPSSSLNLLADGYSVRFLTEPEERQENDVLKAAQVIAVHYIYNIELMERSQPESNRAGMNRARLVARCGAASCA